MGAERETYTHGHAESVLRSHSRRTVADSAAYLADRLVPGTDVLDVGCGPGTISVDVAARVAPGRVFAFDRAAEPLDSARALAAAAGLDTITFGTGDVYAIDAADGTFDVVHAHQVLQHLGDPVAALREMLRVCRPDGVVGARDADYAAMTWYPPDPRLDRWQQIYRAVARGNGAEPDAARHLLAWARAAGARTVVPSASVWCYATAGGPGLVGRHVGGSDRRVGHRRAGGRRRPRGRRGAALDLSGLARVGRAPRRLVRDRARRDRVPIGGNAPGSGFGASYSSEAEVAAVELLAWARGRAGRRRGRGGSAGEQRDEDGEDGGAGRHVAVPSCWGSAPAATGCRAALDHRHRYAHVPVRADYRLRASERRSG